MAGGSDVLREVLGGDANVTTPSLGLKVQQGIAGFFQGVLNDPLVGTTIKSGIELFTGYQLPHETLFQNEGIPAGRVGRMAEKAGEIAAFVGPGFGTFSLGRMALGRLAATFSPRAAAFLAQTGAETVPLARPGVLKAAESLGGALGIGSEEAGRAALEGQLPGEVAARGATGTALTLGGEAALSGAARVLGLRLPDYRKLFGEASPEQVAKLGALDREVSVMQQEVGRRAGVIRREMATGSFQDPTRLTALADLGESLEAAGEIQLQRAEFAVGSKALSKVEAIQAQATRAEASLARESVKVGERLQQLETKQMEHEIELRLGELTGAEPKQLAKLQRKVSRLGQAAGQLRKRASVLEAERRGPVGRAARGDIPIPGAAFYLRDTPDNGGEFLYGLVQLPQRQSDAIRRFLANVIESPTSVGRRQGLAVGVAMNEAEAAALDSTARTKVFQRDVNDLFRELGGALGVRKLRLLLPSAPWARGVRDTYEAGGLDAVRSRFSPGVADVWERIVQRADGEMREAEGVAGALRLSPKELGDLGVGAYFPQIPKGRNLDISGTAKAMQRLMRARGRNITKDEAELMVRKLDGLKRKGLQKVGNLDFERTIPGTTGEKVGAGISMLDDPLQALQVYGTGLARRIEFSRRLGPDLSFVRAIKEVARREGANMAQVHTALDMVTGRTYFETAFADTARRITSVQVMSKLGLSAIPNLSQQVNNVLFGGFRSFNRGLRDLLESQSRGRTMEMVASQEGVLSVLEHVAAQDRRTPLSLAVSAYLNAAGFSPIENLNRILSGMTAQAVAKDIIGKGLAGRLRGATLTRARNQAAALGFDLAKVLQRGGRLTDGELDGLLREAVVRGAQHTQFIPGAARIPVYWQHPYGRVLTQLKSFVFNQARFIRDTVFGEALAGNYKPLAYFLTLYPMAGEMVASTIDTIRDRPRSRKFDPTAPFTDLERYVDSMASVGGFGIFYQLFLSAKFGDLLGSVLGPAVSDVTDFATLLAQSDRLNAAKRGLERNPSYVYGKMVFGGAVVGVEKLVDAAWRSSEPETVPGDDLATELFEMARRKKRAP